MITNFKIFENNYYDKSKSLNTFKALGEYLKTQGEYGIIFKNYSSSDGYREMLNLTKDEYLKYFNELEIENDKGCNSIAIIRNEKSNLIDGFKEKGTEIEILRNTKKYNI